MTRKVLNELAAELKHVKPSKLQLRYGQWIDDCHAIADVCRRFNPAFDRERFLKACGFYE